MNVCATPEDLLSPASHSEGEEPAVAQLSIVPCSVSETRPQSIPSYPSEEQYKIDVGFTPFWP
jgi:hypothetical protein